jgi:DtxR family transcriptional regulator, Mn-dependent transcriptional regulator
MSIPIQEDQEMYLKKLFQIHLIDSKEPIRTSRIAEEMNVSAPSASEMLKRLGRKGFVNYVPYKGVTLTQQGIDAASRVKRREALMEVFLVQMLDFRGDVKDVACRLEHALTDDLESAIDRLLGYPSHTIDGGEIPAANRTISSDIEGILLPLSALPVGSLGQIELVVIDGTDARTLSDMGLEVGSVVQNNGGEWLVNGVSMSLSNTLQSRILVRTD